MTTTRTCRRSRPARPVTRRAPRRAAGRTVAAFVLLSLALVAGCGNQEEAPVAPKLFVFGLDAATWNVITPMIQAGQLPNIAGLVREGSFGNLSSHPPVQSPPMWTTIATGFLPEKHGIDGFMAPLPGSNREVPVTSNMRKVKAFWNILSENDTSVGVVGWWPSWPAEEVDGFMVAQRAWPMNWSRNGIPFGAARDANGDLVVQDFPGRTYPESLYEQFEQFVVTEEDVTAEELGRFFADSGFTDPAKQFHARWVYAKDRTFTDAGLWLVERYRPDVFAIFLHGTDVTAHYYWGYQTSEGFDVDEADARMYGGVVRSYYRFVDEAIGKFLAIAPADAAVLVISDHGFETVRDLVEPWEKGEEIRTEIGGKDVPWDHSLTGVYIMKGPGVRAGHRGPDAAVEDVTPTLLAYLGIAVGEDMDGRPIESIFEAEDLAARPVAYVATHESGDPRGDEAPLESPVDDGIKEKLRSLGYIE